VPTWYGDGRVREWLGIALLSVACERAAVSAPRPLPSAAPPSAAVVAFATPPPAPSAAHVEPAASAPPERAPLPHAGQLVALEVPGFADAVVAVPRSAVRPLPIVVANHGNYDRPTWQCEEWQRIVAASVFVLCPRGEPRPDSPSAEDIRFTFRDNAALERELDTAIAAIAERFAGRIDTGEVLYTGFSLGAILGAKIASRNPTRYSRLVLIEGGHEDWSDRRVKEFASGGGKRVLFLCGQKPCEIAARHAARQLERAGVAARVGVAANLGHSYGGPMSLLAREHLPWLLEGDARWPAP
jgi:dienelactone hydrolase